MSEKVMEGGVGWLDLLCSYVGEENLFPIFIEIYKCPKKKKNTERREKKERNPIKI